MIDSFNIISIFQNLKLSLFVNVQQPLFMCKVFLNKLIRSLKKMPIKNRPKSVPPHSSRSLVSQFRLTDPESLHSIEDRIRSTFIGQNCPWKKIKDLTAPFIDPKYQRRIDRLCHQYSIATKKKLNQSQTQMIDVQSISHRFIKSKSIELKRQIEKSELQRSINSTVNRMKKRLPRSFFPLNHSNLDEMEKKVRKNKTESLHKIHPYLTVYEQCQTEALTNLITKNGLVLGCEDEYPSITEAEDWQKGHLSIKRIYTGIKHFRKTAVFPQQKISLVNTQTQHMNLA